MDQSDVIDVITALDDVSTVEADGNYFFSCTRDEAAQSAHWMPFATLITNDAYDEYSDLNRPDVYRLNIGVSRATYQRLIIPAEGSPAQKEPGSPAFDCAALDRIMPHPIYADQHWVTILAPRSITFHDVKPLLIDAHDRAVARQRAREQHKQG